MSDYIPCNKIDWTKKVMSLDYVNVGKKRLSELGAQYGRVSRFDILDEFDLPKKYADDWIGVDCTAPLYRIDPDISNAVDEVLKEFGVQVIGYEAPVGSKVPTVMLPVPYRVWVTEHGYTTVEWTDGTRTTAHAEDEEHATVYGGFMACVTKKLYGSTTHAIQKMNIALETTAEPAKRKAEQKARRKAFIQGRIKHDKEIREKRIQREMDEIRIRNEAVSRLRREEEFDA